MSNLDDFLKEEGIYEECHEDALQKVQAWQAEQLQQQHQQAFDRITELRLMLEKKLPGLYNSENAEMTKEADMGQPAPTPENSTPQHPGIAVAQRHEQWRGLFSLRDGLLAYDWNRRKPFVRIRKNKNKRTI